MKSKSSYILKSNSIIKPVIGLEYANPKSEISVELKTESEKSTSEIFSPFSNSIWKRFGGIFFSLLACATASLMALVAKLLSQYHPSVLTFWRYMGNTVPSLFIVAWYLFWKKEHILKPLWPLHNSQDKDQRANAAGLLIRGVVGFCMTLFRFSALQYLTLGDVSVITQSTPPIVFIFAFLFLNERCSVVAVISAFLAICGVAILSRPPVLTGESEFSADTLTGFAYAMSALFCSSISIVITRKLRSINFALLILGFGLVGVSSGGILAVCLGVFEFPRNIDDALLTALLASLAFISQIFSVLAIQKEEAGVISIVKISYVLFAFIWQILLLNLYPDLISITGASIILTGLVLTGIRKWINTLPESDGLRKMFSFLLL